MAALPPTPPGLNAIVQYLKLGESMEARVPVLSYWCRTHALKVACESLPTASEDEKAYIMALMGGLEQDKVELASASFNPEDTLTGFKLAKNLGFKYFKKADDDDRGGMASMATAGMFRKASQLFTVALGLNADPQVQEWSKYSKFRAVVIVKDLKAGNIPQAPAGGGNFGEPQMPQVGGAPTAPPSLAPVGGVPSLAPVGGVPSLAPVGGGGGGGYGAPPSLAPVSGVPSLAPLGGGGGGGGGTGSYGAPPSMPPVGGVPSIAPVGGGGGSSGYAAPPSLPPVASPSLPPQSAYPPTAPTLGGSGFTAPGAVPPVQTPVHHAQPPAHVQPAYAGRPGDYHAKSTLSSEEMSLAKKHCTFALSALQYNDPTTGVDNLLQALNQLTN